MDEIVKDCQLIEKQFTELFNKILKKYPDDNPIINDWIYTYINSEYITVLHKMYDKLRNNIISEANNEIQSLSISCEISSVERKNNMFKIEYVYIDNENKVHELSRFISCI